MKEIVYRGGMIRFRLPDSWQEEQYEDGGGVFYDGDPATGTLNLNLTTMTRKEPVTADVLPDVVSVAAEPGDPPAERLPNGNMARRYERRDDGDGAPIHITHWLVASAAPPDTVRLATFGYAIPAGSAGSPAHQAVVAMLDAEIRAAEIVRLSASEVQALQAAHSRPWWKFW